MIAARTPAAQPVVPSIVHLRIGHFSALVRHDAVRDRYLLAATADHPSPVSERDDAVEVRLHVRPGGKHPELAAAGGHDGGVVDVPLRSADQLIAAVKQATDPQATVLQRYAYAYDPGGNRTAEQIGDTVTGATYDPLNRLVSQQPAGGLQFAGTVSEPATVTVQGVRARRAGQQPSAVLHK